MNTRRRVTLQAGSRSGEWWRSLREVALRLDVSRCPSKVCIGAIVAVLCSSAPASAQEWLKDRQASEGPGVLVGDFELHPGIGIQGGYDSNYFLRTSRTGTFTNGGVEGTPELTVTPSISLSTRGAQRREAPSAGDPLPSVLFRATASGTYREFFGQLTPEQRNANVDAAANLSILPGRPWGALVNATYDRVIQPSVFGNPDLSFNSDNVGGSADIVMQPGSGTLDWRLGAQISATLFEESGGQPYDNYSIGAHTSGRWKFRPKTALVYDFNISASSYTNSPAGGGVTTASTTAPATSITPLYGSTPLRTHLGITGLFTPRVAFTALAGYGSTFFSPASSKEVPQFDSVIALAELKFYLAAPPGDSGPGLVSLSQSNIAVGYNRDFQASYLSNYFGTDRGYLRFGYFFAGRAQISLEAGGAAIEYPEIFLPNGTHSPFTDFRVDATLFSEYRFTNSFGLNATVRYTTNISNASLDIAPKSSGLDQEFAMQWQRFEAYLGVRLFL